MKAKIRGTEIYFDVEGAGLVADGNTLREKPVAFAIHGGPGSDHTGLRTGFSPLSDRMQIVYFDHRGSGRSVRGDGHGPLDQDEIDRRHVELLIAGGHVVELESPLVVGDDGVSRRLQADRHVADRRTARRVDDDTANCAGLRRRRRRTDADTEADPQGGKRRPDADAVTGQVEKYTQQPRSSSPTIRERG